MQAQQRDVRFQVERGKLVRYVSRADGRGHVQRATLAALQEVAWFAEAAGENGFTTTDMWEALPDVPATQLSVALDFLKDRGCVETLGRRNYVESTTVFEDAMVEFYALGC